MNKTATKCVRCQKQFERNPDRPSAFCTKKCEEKYRKKLGLPPDIEFSSYFEEVIVPVRRHEPQYLLHESHWKPVNDNPELRSLPQSLPKSYWNMSYWRKFKRKIGLQ